MNRMEKVRLKVFTVLAKILGVGDVLTADLKEAANQIIKTERALAAKSHEYNVLRAENTQLLERIQRIDRQAMNLAMDENREIIKRLNIENKEGVLWIAADDKSLLSEGFYKAMQHNLKALYPKIDGLIISPTFDFKQLDPDNIKRLKDTMDEYVKIYG